MSAPPKALRTVFIRVSTAWLGGRRFDATETLALLGSRAFIRRANRWEPAGSVESAVSHRTTTHPPRTAYSLTFAGVGGLGRMDGVELDGHARREALARYGDPFARDDGGDWPSLEEERAESEQRAERYEERQRRGE